MTTPADRLLLLGAIGAIIAMLILIVGGIFLTIMFQKWEEKGRETAQKKCAEYTEIGNCMKLNKIMLGDYVPIYKYPHMAYLQLLSNERKRMKRSCGGSLISEKFILSAAHCLYGLKNPSVTIKLGSETKNLTDETGEIFTMKKYFNHPKFQNESMQNDIVLIELDREVKFNCNARPICLNTNYTEVDVGGDIIATGWGRTEDGKLSNCLKEVRLRMDGEVESQCKDLLKNINHLLICTGYPRSSKSTHLGDSGGPLQIPLRHSKYSNVYEQIGIIVRVSDETIDLNTTLLSLNAKIDRYVPWIASTVWPDEY